MKNNTADFEITKVIFNDPATVVFWSDGTKTVVKSSENDIYDEEKGLAMAICKKFMGNDGSYYSVFKQWIPDEEEKRDEDIMELPSFDEFLKVFGECSEHFKELFSSLAEDMKKWSEEFREQDYTSPKCETRLSNILGWELGDNAIDLRDPFDWGFPGPFDEITVSPKTRTIWMEPECYPFKTKKKSVLRNFWEGILVRFK